jgi:UDP-glucose:(heptosyl)LPS alpha-1,3-glucosyltransferase
MPRPAGRRYAPGVLRVALTHMRHAATGGTERYLNQLAASLAERGHEVTIVCRSRALPPHPAVRFEVLRPFSLGGAWRVSSFAEAVERHVRERSYDVVYGLGRTWSQDLIRLGGGLQATYLELAHQDTLGTWERRLSLGMGKHRTILEIEARALAPGACWRVVCNSQRVKRDVVLRYGRDPGEIEVIYNGVDVERFHPRRRQEGGQRVRAESGFGREHTLVLFLGTGYGRKGLAEVLEAFPALLRHRPAARLVVVGYDSDGKRHAARAEALGISAEVRFLGGRQDPEDCFAAADVYVLPTRYDPFANSTLEALATGLPTITTEDNGAAELIQDSVQGTVLPRQRDGTSLERALIHWTEPEALRAGALAARELALEHTHVKAMEQSRDLVERCARSKRARS